MGYASGVEIFEATEHSKHDLLDGLQTIVVGGGDILDE